MKGAAYSDSARGCKLSVAVRVSSEEGNPR
jgi:hypothetical protein